MEQLNQKMVTMRRIPTGAAEEEVAAVVAVVTMTTMMMKITEALKMSEMWVSGGKPEMA